MCPLQRLKGDRTAIDHSELAQALAATVVVCLSDTADAPILASVIQSNADALVTGDRCAFARFFRTRVAGVEVLVLRDALRRVVGLRLE